MPLSRRRHHRCCLDHITAAAAGLSVLGACSAAPEPQTAPETRWREAWVLLYLMPYDNDLGAFAAPVLERIQQGTRDGGAPALVLSDLPGPGGMTLTTFADGVARPYPMPALEDAASPLALRMLLEQAAVLYEARRYAVVILDHGGALGALARDDHPAPGRWLSVADVAAEVAAFRAAEPGEVEALFLQVCAKASLPDLYALRHAARYTVASQLLLGAPNDYYTPTLQALGAHPDTDGPGLTALLAQGSMYRSYTCVENAALEALPAHLEATAAASTTTALSAGLAGDMFTYAGERYIDLGQLLQAEGTPAAQAALSWWTEEARCGHPVASAPPASLLQGPDPAHLSGVSAHLPLGARQTALDGAAPGWAPWLQRVSVGW